MNNGRSNKYRKLVNKETSNARTSGIHQTVQKKTLQNDTDSSGVGKREKHC